MNLNDSHQFSLAAAPFDRRDADIVLRTPDNVDFHLHKAILCIASNFFDGMFNIPQPDESCQYEIHHESGIPIVCVSERSLTLDSLLRFCYPSTDPSLKDEELMADVLAAAQKYDMEDVERRIKKSMLVSILYPPSNIPLAPKIVTAYAVAVRLGLEDVACAAAVASISTITFPYVPALDKVSSGALHRLLEFRRRGLAEIGSYSFCTPLEPPAGDDNPDKQSDSGLSAETSATAPGYEDGGKGVIAHNMSTQFCHESAGVTIQSSDNVIFKVFRTILALGSPVLIRKADDVLASPDSSQIVSIDEDSKTLHMLLQLLYPMEEPEVPDLSSAVAVYMASCKYEVLVAKAFAKRQFREHIRDDPLRTYFMASKMGWAEEMREAAHFSLFVEQDKWVPEMEDVPAAVYRQLLDYRLDCQRAIYRRSAIDINGWKTHTSLRQPMHWSNSKLYGADRSSWEVDRILPSIHDKLSTSVFRSESEAVIAMACGHSSTSDDSRNKFLRTAEAVQTELDELLIKIQINL
ncbi:uncharacterized protein LAESUDRAFT_239915 [Laetiporus sulphureus 93-53]|uniref:BTB domain-containing protein n=1 Tax=Laetiporus sulphureus 93-53 TaxID=1314785 RepID=A0A165DJP1_9APHY|nr:uncharacterized protein LAESUDRAFT_239915 [Laetiporus sulphureus 93-53]KZT05032.1 hypothetical protein LAESUDRAFT_239915 [Laetiporus sulphureus 93-53]